MGGGADDKGGRAERTTGDEVNCVKVKFEVEVEVLCIC